MLALLVPLVSGRAALVRRAADPAKSEEAAKEAEDLEGKKEVLKTNEAFYYYYGYPAYPYYAYGYPYYAYPYGYPYATYPIVYV